MKYMWVLLGNKTPTAIQFYNKAFMKILQLKSSFCPNLDTTGLLSYH